VAQKAALEPNGNGPGETLRIFRRARSLSVSVERTVAAHIKTSAASERRLREAIESGTRDFVLAARDGSVSAGVQISIDNDPSTVHRIGGERVAVDWSACTISRGHARVSLSRTELRLLAALISGAGRAMTRRELIHATWPDADLDAAERENALAVYVCALRKRLRMIGSGSALHTVRRVGYQLST